MGSSLVNNVFHWRKSTFRRSSDYHKSNYCLNPCFSAAEILETIRCPPTQSCRNGRSFCFYASRAFLGMFGLIVVSIAMIPMYFIHVSPTFSNNPEGRLEDVICAFKEIAASTRLQITITITVFRYDFFKAKVQLLAWLSSIFLD